MATVNVEGGRPQVDSQPTWVSLVWGSAATWRCVCIHQMNPVNWQWLRSWRQYHKHRQWY